MRNLGILCLCLLACSKKDSVPAIDATPPDAAFACPGTTSMEMAGCVEQTRLSSDLIQISMERVPESPHWMSVQDLCKTRFEAAGFEVTLDSYGTGTNVIGVLPGRAENPKDVIISAHYDHISSCPGADDNASGVAALLEIARILGERSYDNTLVVACWDEEERGLIGSKAYVARAVERGASIAAMVSLEGIGYYSAEDNSQELPPGFGVLFPEAEAQVAERNYRGDFIALISDESSASFVDQFVSNGTQLELTALKTELPENYKLNPATGDLRRSDHASFWAEGYPGIMITDTANFRNPNYHCGGGMDTPDTLDLSFVDAITKTTVASTVDALGLR